MYRLKIKWGHTTGPHRRKCRWASNRASAKVRPPKFMVPLLQQHAAKCVGAISCDLTPRPGVWPPAPEEN